MSAKCGAGPKVDVHVRFARSRDAIYLDMCDDQWRAIEVTKDGWRVVRNPPVLFRRGAGARALASARERRDPGPVAPAGERGDDSQWCLMLAWLVGAFLPEGAFSHLVLHGEQGSAKSTTALVLQSMLTHRTRAFNSPPKDETDATVIRAAHGHSVLMTTCAGAGLKWLMCFAGSAPGRATGRGRFTKTLESPWPASSCRFC